MSIKVEAKTSGRSTEYCSKQFLGTCEYIKRLVAENKKLLTENEDLKNENSDLMATDVEQLRNRNQELEGGLSAIQQHYEKRPNLNINLSSEENLNLYYVWVQVLGVLLKECEGSDKK